MSAALPFADRAIAVRVAQEGGPGDGRAGQRLARRQPGLDIALQLVVQTDAGIVEAVEIAGIGSGQDRNARVAQHRQDLEAELIFPVPGRDLRRRRLGRALDPPFIGLAQTRTDVAPAPRSLR